MITGTQDILAQAIVSRIESLNGEVSEENRQFILDFWGAISEEIINHIVSNAIVSVAVTGATGGGSPGGPLPILAQPGVGNIS